jgi:hypothetical protein
VERGSGAGYDEAAAILGELRDVAAHFKEMPAFEARFRVWMAPHVRRHAFVKRLQERDSPFLGGGYQTNSRCATLIGTDPSGQGGRRERLRSLWSTDDVMPQREFIGNS